jgi:hypothetical protein
MRRLEYRDVEKLLRRFGEDAALSELGSRFSKWTFPAKRCERRLRKLIVKNVSTRNLITVLRAFRDLGKKSNQGGTCARRPAGTASAKRRPPEIYPTDYETLQLHEDERRRWG